MIDFSLTEALSRVLPCSLYDVELIAKCTTRCQPWPPYASRFAIGWVKTAFSHSKWDMRPLKFNGIKYHTIKFRTCIDFQSECIFTLLLQNWRHTSAICKNDALCSAYVMHHLSLICLDLVEAYNVINCWQ